MKNKILTFGLVLITAFKIDSYSQVTTNYNSKTLIENNGVFGKNYDNVINFKVPQKNLTLLTNEEKIEDELNGTFKIFKFATPIKVSLNLVNEVKWVKDDKSEYVFGRYIIKLEGATSASVNFNNFFMPKGSEMYIYNEFGKMVSGPISEKENNDLARWATSVFKGGLLNIEIKVLESNFKTLKLNVSNIASGYKNVPELYVGGFGLSAPCHINVTCPIGNNWINERNSVCLGISGDGTKAFSGVLMMNTCGTNKPLILTANHVYNLASPKRNVTDWRFTFKAWSATCTPSQDETGITYFGTTLKANYGPTDFCLVELNTTPSVSSGLFYAGWDRSSAPASSATSIFHPMGDVMKIAETTAPAFLATFPNQTPNNFWGVNYTTGIGESGASGSPLFNHNKRIIGQNTGGATTCAFPNEIVFFGRFDLSWHGGGTPTTRLSDWLDPGGSDVLTTNTTAISNLKSDALFSNLSIAGNSIICNTEDYLVTNLPPGSNAVWSIPGSAGPVLQLAPNVPAVNQLRITNQKWYGIATKLTANVDNGCLISKPIYNDNSTSASIPFNFYQENCYYYGSCPSQYGTVYSNASPAFVRYGCTVVLPLGDMQGKTVSLAPGSVTPNYWGTTGATSYFPYSSNTLLFQPSSIGGPLIFQITGPGACYTRTLLFFAYSCNARYAFVAAPNPVKDFLNVKVTKNKETIKSDNKEILKTAIVKNDITKIQFTMNIYDVNFNKIQLTNVSSKGALQHTINTSKLKKGYYILQIIEGDEKHNIKFLKE